MRATVSISRRDSPGVVGLAALIGAASGAPIAFLSLVTLPLREALGEGAGLWEALGLPTAEDWEILPFFLLGAVFVGAVVAYVASLVWLLVSARTPDAPWLAHLLAAGLAGTLPALPWIDGDWPLAVSTAVLAGLVALIAAPRVGYRRRQPLEPFLGSAG